VLGDLGTRSSWAGRLFDGGADLKRNSNGRPDCEDTLKDNETARDGTNWRGMLDSDSGPGEAPAPSAWKRSRRRPGKRLGRPWSGNGGTVERQAFRSSGGEAAGRGRRAAEAGPRLGVASALAW